MKRATPQFRKAPLFWAAAAAFLSSCAVSRALYLGDTARYTKRASVETSGSENINGDLPDAVYLKTRTQAFNTYHYYVVREGRIWYKSIDKENEPVEWTLFGKTGLPPRAARVAEISADADELVALDTGGAFYRYCFEANVLRAGNKWLDKQGWPQSEQLLLDAETAKNISWALGKRNAHVLYYEDALGNQHHWGFTGISTTYMLMEDGQEIRYADTGLPSEFAQNFLGPERGAFKAAALSASASTMFVINDAGEMYTRLADFDTTGSDPMFFNYTYTDYVSGLAGEESASCYTAWGLPAEDWRAQPPIPLEGKAVITRYITILQNGHGNAARELRVAGRNAAGETGYWYKQIFADTWQFAAVPLCFDESAILPVNDTHSGERGLSRDTRYAGFFWNDNEEEASWEYEIPNFNLLGGSCDFRVSRHGEICALKLHPVEMWSYLKRDFLPGRSGPPKLFSCALEIPENAFDNLSDEFVQLLKDKFAKNDREYFRYTLAATEDFIILRDVGQTKRIDIKTDNGGEVTKITAGPLWFLTSGLVSNYYPAFSPARFIEYYSARERCYESALLLENGKTTREDAASKILLNKALRDELKLQTRVWKWAQLTAFKFDFGYIPAHYTVRYSPVRFVDPLRIVTSFSDRVVLANSAYTYTISELIIAENEELIALLNARLREYRRLAHGSGTLETAKRKK